MRVLVSNDDGVDAPGIRALAKGLREAGHGAIGARHRALGQGSAGVVGRRHEVAPGRLGQRLEQVHNVAVFGIGEATNTTNLTARGQQVIGV